MSLVYKINTIPNENSNKESIHNTINAIIKLKKCSAILQSSSGDQLEYIKSKITSDLRNKRESAKSLQDEPSKFREIQIKSTKSWKIIPEYYDSESGITRYNTAHEFKVNTKVTLDQGNKDASFKELIDKAKTSALKELREFRKQRKEIAFEQRSFHVDGLPESPTYTVYAGGGFSGEARPAVYKDALRGTVHEYTTASVSSNYFIHNEANTFVELQNSKRLIKIFERKKPLTSDRHVGVEIEFASKLNRIELAKKLFNKGLQNFVCLVEDGSIRPVDEYPHTHELTIIAPEVLIHVVLNKALAAINENNASRVGKRCGLHVHLDMRNRNKGIVYHNLLKSQRILYAMNPRSRLDGTTASNTKDTVWSKKIEWEDFDTAWDELNCQEEDRYYGINILSLKRHNTIEIRIHSGSTNFEKISNWVTILTSIANLTERVETEASKPETFCRYYKLDDSILEYIKMRIAKFRDINGRHITIDEVA